MPAYLPSINGVEFSEGDPAPVRSLAMAVFQVGNPGGGDPGVVKIPARSEPYQMTLKGHFANDAAVPDVQSWQGLSVAVIRHGATQQCIVMQANIIDQHGVFRYGADQVEVVAVFTLLPE